MQSCATAIDVAIVGAGISGIACASALVGSHHTFAVLDARSKVGGRLLSHQGVDMGASWTWPPHETRAAALAAKLGIDLLPQRLDGNAFSFHQGSMRNVGNMGAAMAPCGGDAVRIQGGYARLATTAAHDLPAGTVRLGSTVTKVEKIDHADANSGRNLLRVTYSNAADNTSTELIARRVVLAMPPGVLARSIHLSPALPADQQKKMAATLTWCGDWAKVAANFKSPFWRRSGHSGVVATPGPIQIWWEGGGGEELGDESYALVGLGVGEETRSFSRFEQPPAAGGGQGEAGQSAASADADASALREYVIATLSPAFGASVSEELSSVSCKTWITDPLTYNPEGTHRDYGHPLLRRATAFGVHFAGTETEAANGHVEGAIAAGERAAAEVMASLGDEQ